MEKASTSKLSVAVRPLNLQGPAGSHQFPHGLVASIQGVSQTRKIVAQAASYCQRRSAGVAGIGVKLGSLTSLQISISAASAVCFMSNLVETMKDEAIRSWL